MRLVSLFILMFSSLGLTAQSLTGRVLDSQTGEPVPFANVVYDTQRGVISDIDGRFHIETSPHPDSLHVSYVGYQDTSVVVGGKSSLKIRLSPKAYDLDEVVIKAGENPALRIINQLIAHKPQNNPSNYDTYEYRAYDKIVFTIHPDSLQKYKAQLESDTSFRNLKKVLDKQHLFVSENVTSISYEKPGKKHEEVLASRSAGFRNPVFVLLLSRLQSNSYYNDQISILNKKYINPLTSRAMSRYSFYLRDTLFHQNSTDTTYMISYAPRKGSNFDGLKGMLYVNTDGWALQNVTAIPARADESGLNIKIEQQYEQVGRKHWFPVQLNTEMFFGNIQANGIPIMGRGKRYITRVSVEDSQEKKVPRDIAVEIRRDAYDRGRDSLKKYRQVPITGKEQETYRVIDSIGKAENLDRQVQSLLALTRGAIPFGAIEIPINRLLDYNKYEGLYAGLGAKTNKSFASWLELGAYGGYGFKDERLKYGGHVTAFFDRYDLHGLTYRYKNDLREPAGIPSWKQPGMLNAASYRQLLVNRFDDAESHEFTLHTHPIRFTGLKLGIRKSDLKPLYDYDYTRSPDAKAFAFTELRASIRFAYNEKFIKSQDRLVYLDTEYPIVYLHFSRGFDGFWGGEYEYNKWMLEWRHSIESPLIGETCYRILSGLIDRSVPYQQLFHGIGSYGSFSLYTPYSFSTMRLNEFLADRFAAVFLSHDFGNLLFNGDFFAPSVAVNHNMLIGDLRSAENHQQIAVKSPVKGYFESGVVFANLLKSNLAGLGIGVFYRYGPYQWDNFSDNLTFNLSLEFTMD